MSDRRVTYDLRGELTELVVDISNDVSAEALAQTLQRFGLVGPFSIHDRALQGNKPAVEFGIHNGDFIRGTSALEPKKPRKVGRYLVIVAGPHAGSWKQLPASGTITLGRTYSDIDLHADGKLSKDHVEIALEGDKITIADLGSTNGTYVDGLRVTSTMEVRDEQYVLVGDSVVTVLDIDENDFAVIPEGTGPTRPFQRRFRSVQTALRSEFRLPNPPTKVSTTSNNGWWRSLVPLISGVAMALVTGRWWFLGVMAIAPIIYAVDANRQKQQRALEEIDEIDAYQNVIAKTKQELAVAQLDERRHRRSQVLDGGLSTFYARMLHRRIWEFRPSDPDFTSFSIGLSAQSSSLRLTSPDRAEGQSAALELLPTPVHLVSNGPLAIVGNAARAHAVARAILLNLAVSHAPSEMQFWLFADEQSASEWECARWIPHFFTDDVSARIATTSENRARHFSDLRALLEARTEKKRDRELQLPVHVVFVDGTDLFLANQLSDLLERGAQVGVIGIVLDPYITADGTTSRLGIGESFSDNKFESRSLTVEALHTAELTTETSELAARSLASLRTSSSEGPVLEDSSARLVDLLGIETLSSDALAKRWLEKDPQTYVPIGKTAERVLELDVAEGPHGLIGGMTRSGKTEFLKTLITSLAVSNHPNDLSFIIVDFKGGVDYELARGFPHVIEVSSNNNLDRFERTIRMLSAEKERRERLFLEAGVSNLGTYRKAGLSNARLPAIPRLVLLVDEFGELTANETGRAHLRALESVARVGSGLGINLLLITQNFYGNLPDQIAANSGLRMCFRVQEPAQSKVVLNSGIAAQISPANRGRGYLSVSGADPVEFQSARIAGRRRSLDDPSKSAEVRVRAQAFSSLGNAALAKPVVDVPSEETDMAAAVVLLQKAAALSGWTSPAIPWPEQLSENIGLADIFNLATSKTAIPMGVVDLPDEQGRGIWEFDSSEDHLLVMGGTSADLHGVASTMLVSACVRFSPDEFHFHVIDLIGRGVGLLNEYPHCGSVSIRDEGLATRLLTHLIEEIGRRRSRLKEAQVANLAELQRRTGQVFPRILLVVLGADRLFPSQGNENGSPLASPISLLASDAIGLGIQLVLVGHPRISSLRPGINIENRLALIIPTPTDYATPTVSRSLLAELGPPRRAIDLRRGTVVELCSLSGGDTEDSEVIEAVLDRLESGGVQASAHPPKRFTEIGYPFRLGTFLQTIEQSDEMGSLLPICIENTSGTPVTLDQLEDGSNWLVAGGPKSGRSNFLLNAGCLARRRGSVVFGVAFSKSSLLHRADGIRMLPPESIADALHEYRTSYPVLLVDDLHRCDPTTTAKLVSESQPWMTFISGPSSIFGMGFRQYESLGLVAPKHGFVVAPSGTFDPFPRLNGVRADWIASRRPGHGLFYLHGEYLEVTVPFVEIELNSKLAH
jgi:DNA segregation ATPase FtsK/SpoIIIE, S-DNA-T family